ncbi:MAG: PKD domain-containing protein [Lutibacter sp.]|uniref:PKD domain-containing protein n=1 Tax=Lutibacter sp. TaxID=1925666 RepID=UPI00182EAA53|nr:PKD domain-containing protein [Lutibacter sp.]MBT8318340.1 PKD domain-containing protein [Lutibacter sp.]NNJ59198.1 PKD domain-containing protein [Lutibacter sp.]
MKNYVSALFVLLLSFTFYGQAIENDTIERTATIEYSVDLNRVSFNPKTPQLNQIAGAPKAFYTYYWEFGDGDYSFEEKPKHTYKKKGNYNTQLSVTNNYDDGKPPATRPKEVAIQEANFDTSENENHNLVAAHNGFRLQTNRDPVPDEEMQLVLSYGNTKEFPTSGRVYVFFNEKKYKAKNFDLVDVRLHHNEKEISDEIIVDNNRYISKNEFIKTTGVSTFINEKLIVSDTLKQNLPLSLEEAKAYYQDVKVYDVDYLEANEERNMFFSFKTTPEMLKDTSAVISIRSIYVPERGNDSHKVLTKEMEIVTSHDPNKMAVYDTRLNYRLVRFKRLKYKVRFQNDGEGPARLIKLNVDIPEMLDKSSLKVLDMYPECPICPEEEVRYSCLDTIILKDQISFQFKNIYLPGTAQKGVHDKDSTKGFVKYSLKFGNDFHKKKSKSKTAIIFDKNEPIITNTSTSRFSPGISIGVKSGYNSYLDVKDSKSYFVGATISPYKSYKKYLQAEIMISTHEFGDFKSSSEQLGPVILDQDVIIDSAIRFDETNSEITKLNIDVVPISFRYNLNGVIGLGIGPQLSFDVSNETSNTTNSSYFTYLKDIVGDPIEALNETIETETNSSFSDINYGIFGDVTIGASRIGPSVGVRYLYNLNQPHSQLHFYAIWKI